MSHGGITMLLNAKEMREELKLSKPTFAQLVKDGLPRINLTPRNTRFDREDVIKWFKDKAM
jgi:predicted DNA-binding transcriptional regulator AlpA